MAMAQIDKPPQPKSLRLWPGVAIVVLQWLGRFIIPIFSPDSAVYGVMGALLGGIAVLIWWAFFSRAPRLERWGGTVLIIVALVATPRILHESLARGGMGFLSYVYILPVLNLGLVIWAMASRHLADRPRRLALIMTILLACGVWSLFRTGGITGTFDSDFAWRWAQSPEEQLLAKAGDEPTGLTPAAAVMATGADWPGFRGPQRDGIVHGVRIKTDWSTSPPTELWRRPVGPGWSSFAVRGNLLYTQEQRGDDELVACYNVTTGQPVWRHSDPVRFWESNAGAGPRATPSLSNGQVYAFGATGILNVLAAGDGSVVWSRDTTADTNIEVPTWGFSSSPLVVDDVVIIAAAGKLAAYDRTSGEPRWFGPDGGQGYSSPHLMTLGGVAQILLLSGAGAAGFTPADGTLLWDYPWPGGMRIVQPAMTADGEFLISAADSSGMRRMAVAQAAGIWSTEERWTSNRLKPIFNDFVVHDGHAFGFDGNFLAGMDLADGKRKWKGGRYGSGQLVLLADQGLLLVLSEQGELALVKATPDQFTEVARFGAIAGKTWNHPVLAGDVLLVRNGQEMAAFRLSLAGG